MFLGDALYEAGGKHTYPPMVVIISSLGVVLITFLAFYKQLAPRFAEHQVLLYYYNTIEVLYLLMQVSNCYICD